MPEEKSGQYFITEEPADALVIHCSDPRFQKAFRRFLKNELGVKNPVPLLLGGSVHPFGSRATFMENFQMLRQQIKFFLEEGKIIRVVIINHDDCKWYQKFKDEMSGAAVQQKMIRDLLSAAEYIIDSFSIKVETYFARLKGKEIIFEEVRE